MKQKILMTLALLLTAVGGAWAEDAYEQFSTADDKEAKLVFTGEHFKITGTKIDEFGMYVQSDCPVTISALNGETITKVEMTINYLYSWDATYTIVSTPNATIDGAYSTGQTFTITPTGANASEVTLSANVDHDNAQLQFIEWKVYYADAPASEPDIKVTTNAAEEGGTFTEASFTMPAFDATVDYELVRDMGYKVAFSGVPTRARLAKDGNGKFHFADGLTFQLLDNIDAANPKDITSAEGITFMVGEVEAVDMEGNTFYQLNKETLVPLADFLADAHLGNYVICAVASTGEYDGSFSSDMITLFQGYEVKVPAKKMITYYKDEPLYADTETSGDAELYTISSVSGDQVVLSDAIETAPSYTPLLVYNKGNQDKTFLLIPVDAEPNLALTVAPEFQGTLVARTTDDTSDDYGPWNMAANTKYYGCNGNDFVWIKNAGDVDAHRCWIEISTANAPSRLTIVFEKEETTDIDSMEDGRSQMEDGAWYDLSGRKLDGEPTTKGVYIKDGKKVVVR